MSTDSVFRKIITIKSAQIELDHSSEIFVAGSCFVNHIGNRLIQHGFNVSHPFGTLYNPITIAQHFSRINAQQTYTSDDVIQSQEAYYSWHHNNVITHPDKDQLLKDLNQQLSDLKNSFKKSSHIIISLGSAWVYEYPKIGIVGNCHKISASSFNKRILTVDEIVHGLSAVIDQYPNKTFIFTVSPVRHWADGPEQNTQSKSVLHLATRELTEAFSNCSYFPSYEIMMDELRDYRFYAKDMLHPSQEAIDYIWSKFIDFSMKDKTKKILLKIEKVRTGLEHRPFQKDSDNHQQFLKSLLKEIEQVIPLTPFYSWEQEIEKVRSQLR